MAELAVKIDHVSKFFVFQRKRVQAFGQLLSTDLEESKVIKNNMS